VVTVLAIGGAELLAMIVLSVWGAVKLPPEARVPVHWGGRWGNFQTKRAGLIAYPVVGAFLFVFLVVVGLTVPTHGNKALTPTIFLPIVLCIILLTQVRAIDQARRGPEAGPSR